MFGTLKYILGQFIGFIVVSTTLIASVTALFSVYFISQESQVPGMEDFQSWIHHPIGFFVVAMILAITASWKTFKWDVQNASPPKSAFKQPYIKRIYAKKNE